jgi:hypothetical protein
MKLRIIDSAYSGVQLQCVDEDDTGAILGQSSKDGRGEAPIEREAYEYWRACQICRESSVPRQRGYGFFWPNASEARVTLRAIKLALLQERPLPEWAKVALAAGWKPPKGWKA